jgi:HSP20 family protein
MTSLVRRTGTDAGNWAPLIDMNRLSQQLSRLFDEEWSEFPFVSGEGGFAPLADVEETDDAFLVEVDLPGVKKKDVKVEVEGRRLVVSGERKERQRIGLLRRQTRAWGNFRLEIVLPAEVDEDKVEAKIDEGVLHLRVPKSAAGHRRQIEVK